MSEFLRFYVEEHIRRKRDQGEPIEPAALAKEVIGRLPNYRHLKKQIAAIAVEMAAAMNSAEITAHFGRRSKRAAVRLSVQSCERRTAWRGGSAKDICSANESVTQMKSRRFTRSTDRSGPHSH